MGLVAALDFTYDATKSFTDPRIYEEMRGISDASGVDYSMLMRVHMIAGLTQGKCSMFGAWGQALDPSLSGHLLQLRALDWDMSSPVRDYSAITVYHPTDPADGHAFAMVGMVAFIGALTGVSSAQVGISEIGVDFPDSTFGTESRMGNPFIFVLREILQYDQTLDDALTRIADTTRTCDLILGVGDGKMGLFRSVAYSGSSIFINDDFNMRPANTTWHPRLPSVVYHGMDWACPSFNFILHDQLKKNYGKLTAPTAISQVSAVEQSGDNHIAIYDLTAMTLYVSFASPFNATGPASAYQRQYTLFNLTALFAEQPPQN
jgi:isopenicillin-N N-acyltransferase-like protein